MRKIIITGAGGFIGFNTSIFFLKKKYQIIGIDNLSRKGSYGKIRHLKKNFKNFTFYKCDITDFKKLNNTFKKYNKIKAVIHTAGQVTVTESIINPIDDFKINSMGTLYVLELTKKYFKKAKIIYSSTNKIYGNLNNLKIKKKNNKYLIKNYKNGIDEKYKVDYCSPYGCSKGSADQYLKDYARIYNMNTTVLRKSCIYGHEQLGLFGQGWISFIINQAIMNKQINVFGDGFQTRDILYIDDLVNLYGKIVKKNSPGYEIFNVGGGYKNLLSVKELILYLRKKGLIKKRIVFKKERPGDQKTYYSNLKKLKATYNWSPKISSENGLNKILKYSLDNINLLKKIYN